MSEKVRSLNLSTAGGGGGGAGVTSAGVSTTLIGNPTLISSTLGTNHNLTPTIDLLTSPSLHHHHQQQQQQHHHQHHHQHHQQQGSDIESLSDYAPGTITAQLNFQILPANTTATDTTNQILTGQHHHGNGINFDYNSIMNTSQMSAISQDSLQQPQQQQQNSLNAAINNATTAAATATSQNCMALVKAGAGKPVVAQSVAGKTCRFPKLEECAHFHYERVQLGPLSVRLVDDKSELLNSSIASQSIGGDIAGAISSSQGPPSYRSFSPSSCWFIIKVFPHRSDAFLVKRSFDNMQMFDEMLHRCVYDRKISGLKDLNEQDFKSEEDVEYAVAKYLERFSKIASDSLTCGTILTWLQLDNKGRRLPLADDDTMRCINTPAVGAAYGVRRYQAQASDEISIEVGDMISVIDMPSPAESVWWRGKKSHLQKSHYEVGFFPQSCVATIGDKVPRNFPMPAPLVGQLDVSPTKPVLRKHGKLIAFFRSFILSRPSRRRLKQSGIYRERVFSCDLSEHLLNSGQEIPMVLKCCAEFIEEYGIVDGIYRLSGITSNIQKLRRAFDEERVPDLGNPEMKQDIHAVSSLLKMYFRELPNPLCTYQLYDNFVEAIQTKGESTERLRLMKETVLKLPPPHYRTLKYLSEHLNKISQFSDRTGMTDKNLAIVWAPNLLRSPALESGGVAALRGVGVQAVVTEYLIRNCHHIFDVLEEAAARLSYIATQAANAAATHTPSSVTSENRMDSLTDCESLLVEQREHDQSMTACVVERPKSLSAGGPKLISLEEAQERHLKYDGFDMKHSMPINMISSVNSGQNIGSYIEVGGGPSSLPDKYHTVLSAPRSWQKRKTHSWKSLFSRNQRPVSNGAAHDLKSSIVISSTHRHNEDDDESSSPPASHRRHHSKEVNQVTFADVDSIIGENGKSLKAVGGSGLLKRDDKHKSIELFETSRSYCGEASKPIEICVRSNSIDSLRTAGHSRSVSHDSYFDLLQSPLKGQLTTCPSRELSELGLNFDREEPEMRIFSESESLVSSPRVGKENIPPSSGSTSRRIMRARPEEFSSQTNSVNPSPKKQPRLNLLLSPSAAAANSAAAGNWSERGIGITAASSGGNAAAGQHNVPSIAPNGIECSADNCKEQHNGDESCCKRYKLEDQLSDIQYIDCGTPEHAVNNPQTMFTNVQVHAPPKPSLSKSSLYGSSEIPTIQRQDSSKTSSNATSSPSYSSSLNTRYSYPSVQLGAKRKDQEANAQAGANSAGNAKERFSYPGTTKAQQQHQHEKRYGSKEITPKMLVEEMEAAAVRKKEGEPHLTKARTVSFSNTPSSNNSSNSSPKTTNNKQHLTPKPTAYDLHKIRNRNSYCAASNDHQLQQSLQQQLLLRSYSGDITKENKTAHNNKSPSHRHLQHSHHLNNEMEQSKLSVTPSSPMQSPRYSLLMGGDTSSENSSAVNTPQHDLEPLMMASIMSGISGISAASSQQMQQLLLGDTASSYMGTSRESLQSNVPEKRDMQALKRELSLDLNTIGGSGGPAGNSTVHQGNANHSKLAAADLTAAVRNQNMISPNSNFTDNTSQSVTPSEFGYQHLQRQLSMHSLIETEENSPAYDDEYENTPSNLNSPLLTTNSGHSGHTGGSATVTASSGNNKTLASPIKSTISITYNLKSPTKDSSAKDKDNKLGLMEEAEQERSISESITLPLETSFDENVVYEQVKMFRNSVIEVNQLLNNEERKFPVLEKNLQEIEELSEESKDSSDKQTPNENLEDIQMCEDEKLLYQNVELRKPKSVYQNILGEEMKSLLHEQEQEHESSDEPDDAEVELDSLDSIPDDHVQLDIGASARKSPSNFSVKELATKFEISPVEQMPAFDFSASAHRSSLRTTRPPTINNHTHPERNAKENKPAKQRQQVPPKPPRLKQQQQEEPPQFRSHHDAHHQEQQRHSLATHHQSAQKLNKNQAFTRSLDENAFIREFGTRNLQELTIKSSQQIPDASSADFSSRRKSFDFTRPKTLNPPKRLPGMPIAEEQHYSTPIYSSAYSTTYSSISPSSQKTNAKEKNYNNLDTVSDYSSLEHEYETCELKITPTTENRISLIQNNVQQQLQLQQDNNLDLNNSNNANANPQMKVLSGVKLDRDRINRIKEERRQQLTQKYHTDSLKSKSKTDLNSLKNDDEKFSTDHQNPSLRVKSKSRADMRTLQKDMDNLKEFGGRNPPASAVSETTLNSSSQQQQHRVRSISDEKNQNSYQQQEQQQQQQQQTNVNNLNSANNELSVKRSSHASVQRIKNVGSITANDEEFSARATVHKFERKSMDLINGGLGAGTATGVTSTNSSRERSRHGGGEGHIGSSMGTAASRNSISSNREKISPQFSIRDVTAMFESRSQNQQ